MIEIEKYGNKTTYKVNISLTFLMIKLSTTQKASIILYILLNSMNCVTL